MRVSQKLSRFAWWTKEKVKSSDSFPNQITLSYKGDSDFKTLLGGLVSLVIKLILLTYGISLFIILIRRKGTIQTKNSVVTDLTKNEEAYLLDPSKFGFAFTFFGENGTFFHDESYFKFEVTQVYREDVESKDK